MKIYHVKDPEFCPYGRVLEGDVVQPLMEALLQHTPLPDEVVYTASEPELEKLPAAAWMRDHVYGGMPIQLGWCNGHNTKLNCLEYHRDSEVNLGTEDFILLLAKEEEICGGLLDTACVKAFLCPAGTMVEVYATALHYAPCEAKPGQGFRVMVALPRGTNADRPGIQPSSEEDTMLWARNKWLLAHPESDEAGQGAYIGLKGHNLDIRDDIETIRSDLQ